MVSLSEYVENCRSQISNRLMNKVYFRVFALFHFAKKCLHFFFCQHELKKGDKLT